MPASDTATTAVASSKSRSRAKRKYSAAAVASTEAYEKDGTDFTALLSEACKQIRILRRQLRRHKDAASREEEESNLVKAR